MLTGTLGHDFGRGGSCTTISRPHFAMIVKPCIAASAAVGLTSSALVGALHASGPGGLPRGARGTTTRGGQGMEATGSGFDLGSWFKQAFTPQTAAAVKKKAG